MNDIASIFNLPATTQPRILVTGAGVTGIGTAQLLETLPVAVTLVDANPQGREHASSVLKHTVVVAPEELDWAEIDLVVTSPGWSPTAPLLQQAQEAGLRVIGDVELAYRLDRAEVFGAPRTWVAITGTNGKSTTTAMTAAMLQAGGLKAQAVGNIGIAIADALRAESRIDVLVAELSSFQLHWTDTFVPDVGVLLNLAEDHLDWHGSMQAYADAKAKVLQAPAAIAGVDDAAVRALVERLAQPVIGFSAYETPQPQRYGVADGALCQPDGQVIGPAQGISPPGPAGVLNALAAAAVAQACGVSNEAVAQALSSFETAKHRGQQVASAGDIIAIDNSKATNPHAAHSALAGFDRVVWIAGGQLKGASVDQLVQDHAHALKAVALLGQDREIIAASVRKYAPEALIMVTEQQDPEDAMREVCAWAATIADPGDAIVLAPAAASLDMYSGMAQRGDLFTQAISTYLQG